ncbi:MAG: SDR family oxidoreductase [Nanoarchaeota archaeon]|nr:SDR family oxidoreductase [Nanoarchaeota archaeon]
MFSLKNKVAIVTGAARGIGQSIAIELARNGADVVVSDIIPGNTTVDKIKKLNQKAIYIKTDISSKEQVENLIQQTIKQFKKIDILVNNAGIFIPGETKSLKEEDWNKTININLKGHFLCSQAALKHMKKGASIINISSVAGIMGYSQAAAYCASKGGIRLLTKSLAAEYGPQGIRVNSIHPGIIETEMTKGILADKKTKQGMLTKLPLKRTGKPIDIAGPAVFLASDASSYITGEELIVDGGWTATL